MAPVSRIRGAALYGWVIDLLRHRGGAPSRQPVQVVGWASFGVAPARPNQLYRTVRLPPFGEHRIRCARHVGGVGRGTDTAARRERFDRRAGPLTLSRERREQASAVLAHRFLVFAAEQLGLLVAEAELCGHRLAGLLRR